MKGSEAKLISYMQGADKRFIIPVYQRNYDWKTENCRQLYDDLVKVIRHGKASHFFGSIVSVHNDGAFNEYLVIDGQQRLTTVSLLLLAMYRLMKDGAIVPLKANLADMIYKTYLIDEWQDDDTRIKLKPVKNDRAAFDRLFGEASEHIEASNLTINYNYFLSRIRKQEITIDELYLAVSRLEIINITLNQEDNPQLIFESLNSTGLALSEGDKIRNYILMGLPSKQQNDYYEKYWNRIELCTDYEVSAFIRDYLSVKQQSIPSISRVYFTFKEYVEQNSLDTEALLQDLLAYAKRYEILLNGKTPDKPLNACITRLNRLETTVTRPFFLEVLRMQDGGMPWKDVREIFLYTESYLFRRTICDLPTNALNKIFLFLHREIVRFDGSESNYVEKYKFALLSKSERGRFPDDAEFIAAFSTRSIYSMNSKNKIYILERFENFGTIEDKDIYSHCDDGDYSIEHIMPQHLTPAWEKALGEDYEQIHEVWLHRLANLTLTGYNSKYSNSSFADKRDKPNGFRDSGLRMNTWIANQENWSLAQLEERNTLLMNKALEIWHIPETAYIPPMMQMDYFALDDDIDFTGRSIAKYRFNNTEQPVDSWVDMMEQVLKMLHNEDKSVLTMLSYDGEDSELSPYVSRDARMLRSALEIDDGIFVERNTSTAVKISLLRKFFKAYNEQPEALVFYLKPTDIASKEDCSDSEELRRRYWSFALETIKAAHADTGVFQNVCSSRQNWIAGSIGINGYSINCVANMSFARVEFYIAYADKATNKARYDALYAHRDEIERQLGIKPEWIRNDDRKSSLIYVRLDDVALSDENTWPQMAKFHAEWSRRLYDVIVPYIRKE